MNYQQPQIYQPYQNQIQALQNQFTMPQQYNTQQQDSSIKYVNGKESANAYQMQPNTSVLLMDSNNPKFYIKTSDASGFCTVRTFNFSEETEANSDKYITREEFEKFKNSLTEVKHESNNEHARK